MKAQSVCNPVPAISGGEKRPMKIIIIGCGRVGARLAQTLSLKGCSVTVVDKDPTAFDRLGKSYQGRTVQGVGFDRDVLIEAGIEKADGLAAVMVSDEANAVAARIAKRMFRVPRVVARIYEPRKAEIYRRLASKPSHRSRLAWKSSPTCFRMCQWIRPSVWATGKPT